jgi:S1-C subfamily serine protease
MPPEETGADGAPDPDDAPSGPPPNPLDRPWVHPSELRSFVATPTSTARDPRPKEWAIGLSAALAGVVATLLVLVAFGAIGGRHRSPLPPPVVTSPGDVVDYAVAERVGTAVAPSVVTVRVGAGDASRPVGSGVVLTSDRVVTALHNLGGATTDLGVVTNGGQQLPAKIVGTDPQTDLALLSVSGSGLRLAKLGPANSPRVGQTVVAVSAGAHYRVSIDVISDRDVMVDAGTGIDVAGLLQTGITVTPDMSGGALVDAGGNLVAILTRSASGKPDGLAVPVSTVRDVQDQLDGSGKVAHGWLGVMCTEDPAARPAGGATVQGVTPGSPAALAGLRAGDVVVRAEGRAVSGRADLVAAVRSLRPEDSIDLVYVRDGRDHNATATLKASDPQLLLTWPTMG